MSRLSIFFILVLVFISATHAQQNLNVRIIKRYCYKTSITNNYKDGGIIETDDGHMYEIDDYYTFDTQLWLPGDDLLVCCTEGSVNGYIVKVYTLRNLDDSDSEKADAYRIK